MLTKVLCTTRDGLVLLWSSRNDPKCKRKVWRTCCTWRPLYSVHKALDCWQPSLPMLIDHQQVSLRAPKHVGGAHAATLMDLSRLEWRGKHGAKEKRPDRPRRDAKDPPWASRRATPLCNRSSIFYFFAIWSLVLQTLIGHHFLAYWALKIDV